MLGANVAHSRRAVATEVCTGNKACSRWPCRHQLIAHCSLQQLAADGNHQAIATYSHQNESAHLLFLLHEAVPVQQPCPASHHTTQRSRVHKSAAVLAPSVRVRTSTATDGCCSNPGTAELSSAGSHAHEDPCRPLQHPNVQAYPVHVHQQACTQQGKQDMLQNQHQHQHQQQQQQQYGWRAEPFLQTRLPSLSSHKHTHQLVSPSHHQQGYLQPGPQQEAARQPGRHRRRHRPSQWQDMTDAELLVKQLQSCTHAQQLLRLLAAHAGDCDAVAVSAACVCYAKLATPQGAGRLHPGQVDCGPASAAAFGRRTATVASADHECIRRRAAASAQSATASRGMRSSSSSSSSSSNSSSGASSAGKSSSGSNKLAERKQELPNAQPFRGSGGAGNNSHRLPSLLKHLLLQHMPHFRARQYANTLYALARLHCRDVPLVNLLLQGLNPARIGQLKPQEFANVAWALGRLRVWPPQCWLDAFYRSSGKQLSGMDDAAPLSSGNQQQQQQGPHQVTEQPQKTKQGFKPQEIANLVWGLGRLHLVPPKAWLQMLMPVLHQCTQCLTPQQLSNVVWALAAMRGPRRGAVVREGTATYATGSEGVAAELNGAGAAAHCLVGSIPSSFLCDVAAVALCKVTAFSPEELSSMVWGLHQLHQQQLVLQQRASGVGQQFQHVHSQQQQQLRQQQQQHAVAAAVGDGLACGQPRATALVGSTDSASDSLSPVLYQLTKSACMMLAGVGVAVATSQSQAMLQAPHVQQQRQSTDTAAAAVVGEQLRQDQGRCTKQQQQQQQAAGGTGSGVIYAQGEDHLEQEQCRSLERSAAQSSNGQRRPQPARCLSSWQEWMSRSAAAAPAATSAANMSTLLSSSGSSSSSSNNDDDIGGRGPRKLTSDLPLCSSAAGVVRPRHIVRVLAALKHFDEATVQQAMMQNALLKPVLSHCHDHQQQQQQLQHSLLQQSVLQQLGMVLLTGDRQAAALLVKRSSSSSSSRGVGVSVSGGGGGVSIPGLYDGVRVHSWGVQETSSMCSALVLLMELGLKPDATYLTLLLDTIHDQRHALSAADFADVTRALQGFGYLPAKPWVASFVKAAQQRFGTPPSGSPAVLLSWTAAAERHVEGAVAAGRYVQETAAADSRSSNSSSSSPRVVSTGCA